MDLDVKKALEGVGVIDAEDVIGVAASREVGGEVVVAGPQGETTVAIRPISALFVGSKNPPSFAKGPTPEYEPFFKLLERTVIDCCEQQGRSEYDAELERLYLHLRRRPDGADGNPIFAQLQAAARLFMSLHDVSRAEFEAVAQRLSRSAGRFKEGVASTNYCRTVGKFV